jgi:hypothetical protein
VPKNFEAQSAADKRGLTPIEDEKVALSAFIGVYRRLNWFLSTLLGYHCGR